MFEKVESSRRGVTRRLTKRGRKYLWGISLAVLPIVTATGIMTEEMAVLYATLLGAILVPWLGLSDSYRHDEEKLQLYEQGLDDGHDAATGNDEGEEWRN